MSHLGQAEAAGPHRVVAGVHPYPVGAEGVVLRPGLELPFQEGAVGAALLPVQEPLQPPPWRALAPSPIELHQGAFIEHHL